MRRYLFILLPSLLLLLSPAAVPAQPPEVRRVLHTFDFEERGLGNIEDLPMHWVKVVGEGLPHYVNGRLSTDAAHGGRYSFRFDLNGGSLIYRYEPGLIRVKPGSTYHLECFCRTTPLPHARVRLTGYLVDQDSRIVPGSLRHSAAYAAAAEGEDWHSLSLDVAAVMPSQQAVRRGAPVPASLVIELELLQPAQFEPPVLGKRTLHPQDIRGSAWFDDLSVSQVPRVAMATDRPGNVFRRSDHARLYVNVDDTFTDDLAAQLLVRDAAGKEVYQRSGALAASAVEAAGPDKVRLVLDVPTLPAGWYEAGLVMSSGNQWLGTQKLDFVQLPDDRPAGKPDGRFGFIATDLPFAGWEELPHLLPLLSAGRVKLALWGPAGDIQEMDAGAFDALLERLQSLGIRPTACLLDLPPALASALDADALARSPDPEHPLVETGWARLLKADPKLWQPQLSYLISRHANHLDRWQLGADGSEAFVNDLKTRAAYARIYEEFAKLVEKPDLAMPWPAWYEPDAQLPATVALSVPPQVVLPGQLPLYIQDPVWKSRTSGAAQPATGPETAPSTTPSTSAIKLSPGSSDDPFADGPSGAANAPSLATAANGGRWASLVGGEHHLSLSLQWLDRDRYGREAQLRDLAQRLVYALSADAGRIDMPLPFNVRPEPDGTVSREPQETLLPLRTLIATLGGATYKGKMPVADGVEAFLFDRDGRGILVAWDRSAGAGGAVLRELALNLGPNPSSIDLWGNERPLLKKADADKPGYEGAGQVRVTLGVLPLILVDIDGQLAQLRSSVALDRPLIESNFHPHTRRVRFVNTFRTPISGSLRLRPPDGWKLSPPSFSFSLNPGEAFEQEVELAIPYSSVAGPKTIRAEFFMPGEPTPHFTVPVAATLGLTDVGMQSVALRDGGDVVVQQLVTNYGEQPINYGAFAVLAGQARQERLVINLAPGRTAVKRYRFAAPQAGTEAKLRVGVRELGGTRILNDEVRVQ